MRIGNFSVVPDKILHRLVVVSEVWNHYAVGTLKARVEYEEVDTYRGLRLAGKSKMNFVSLVMHGLSAISVYGDTVGVRLLIGTCALILLIILGIVTAVIIRLTTTLAIPGWATYVTALLLIILMQAVTLSFFSSFLFSMAEIMSPFFPKETITISLPLSMRSMQKDDIFFVYRQRAYNFSTGNELETLLWPLHTPVFWARCFGGRCGARSNYTDALRWNATSLDLS
jgi:hypothetical protein